MESEYTFSDRLLVILLSVWKNHHKWTHKDKHQLQLFQLDDLLKTNIIIISKHFILIIIKFNLHDIYSACSNTEHFPVIFVIDTVSSLVVNKTSCLKNCLPEQCGRSVGAKSIGP